jgi:hypothetical protein
LANIVNDITRIVRLAYHEIRYGRLQNNFFSFVSFLVNVMNTMRIFSGTTRLVGFFAAILLGIVLLTDVSEAQRRGGGGSFGGARRSSPSFAPSRPAAPSSSAPSNSFGGQRSMTSPAPQSMQRSSGSFGGSRAMGPAAATDYRKSYGIPRQSTPVAVPGASTPYMMHSYGGYSDGLMMGYMMGRTSAMWSMPFHPAFYYSRPVYVTNPDGTVEVYPPTFSLMKLFMTIVITGLLVWLIVWIVRRRRGNDDMSQSSFA